MEIPLAYTGPTFHLCGKWNFASSGETNIRAFECVLQFGLD